MKSQRDDPLASYLLGSIRLKDKRYEEAVECFVGPMKNYVFLKEIHLILADIYEMLGLKERSRMNKKMADTIDDWMAERL